MMSEFSVLHFAVVIFSFFVAALLMKYIGRKPSLKSKNGGSKDKKLN